jgi:exocyst complex component 2
MMVVKDLDTKLFNGYVKPKSSILTDIIRNGILDSNMDWFETPQPTGQWIMCTFSVDIN